MLSDGMLALRRASLTLPALLFLGAKLDPSPPEPVAPLLPACPSSGVRGLSADDRGRRSFYLASELAEIRAPFAAAPSISREPWHIDLVPAGAPEEKAGLALEVRGSGGASHCLAIHLNRPERCFDLDLSCGPGASGAGEMRSAHWIWLDAHRALTDLLPVPAQSELLASLRSGGPDPFQELALLKDPYLALLKDPAYPEYPLREVVELENPADISALLERARSQDAGTPGTPPLPASAEGCR